MTRVALLEVAVVATLLGLSAPLPVMLAARWVWGGELILVRGSWWSVTAASGIMAGVAWLAVRAFIYDEDALSPSAAAVVGAISGAVAAATTMSLLLYFGVEIEGHSGLLDRSRTTSAGFAVAPIAGVVYGVFAAWLGRKVTGRNLDW